MSTPDPRFGITIPILGDPADITGVRNALLGALSLMMGVSGGTYAARPAFGTFGRMYRQTDTGGGYGAGTIALDTGAAWQVINPITAFGTTATTAAAGNDPRLLAGEQGTKAPVRAVHLSNIANLANPGTMTYGGIVCVAGDRVLLAGQTSSAENGIWIVGASSSTPLARGADMAAGSIVAGGCTTTVSESTVPANVDSLWIVTTNDTSLVVGTDAQAWARIASPAAVAASGVTFTPTGTVAATDVQSAIAEVALEAAYDRNVAPVLIDIVDFESGSRPDVVRDTSAPVVRSNPGTLPAGQSNCVAWSPDGRFLAIGLNVSPYIAIYERNGQVLTKLTDPVTLPAGLAGVGRGIAWSPDGQFLVVAHATTPYVTIYQRSGSTFTKLTNPASLPAGNGYAASWTRDGRFLAIGHVGTPFLTIYERSGTTFTKLANPGTLPSARCTGVDWSPDGRFLATVTDTIGTGVGLTIYERNGTTFTKLADPTGVLSYHQSVSFSPDGRFLCIGGDQAPDTIILFERSGSTFTKLTRPASTPGGTVWGTAWSPDGRYLFAANPTSPKVYIYARSGTTFTKAPDLASIPSGNCYGVAPSPDARFLAVARSLTPFISWFETAGGVPAGAPSPIAPLDY